MNCQAKAESDLLLSAPALEAEPASEAAPTIDNPETLQVSVIIPHYNDLERLQTCLQLLAQQTLPRHCYEVIVADNNSAVGLEAVQRAVGSLARVVDAPEQGAGAARNQGVAASQGKYLAFIDADCLPAATWLEQGLQAVQSAQLIGGRVEVAPNQPGQLSAAEAFELVFAFNNEYYVKQVGFSVTANMFVARSVFEAVGPFRQQVSEDKEWGLRAARLGYAMRYDDDVRVQHPARRNWKELSGKWQKLTREEYLLAREGRFGRLIWLLRSWLILLSPFKHSLTVLKSKKLSNLKDKIGVIGMLFRIRTYRFWETHRVFLKLR